MRAIRSRGSGCMSAWGKGSRGSAEMSDSSKTAGKEETKAVCLNCKSRRRGVQRAGFCSKCYYWHRKRVWAEHELSRDPKRSNLWRSRYISVPIRVLEEYAWREEQLQAEDVHPLALESMVRAVAVACRSEIGLALYSLLALETPSSRKRWFMVLLEILENTPSRRPLLHTLRDGPKGSHRDGWADWYAYEEERRTLPIKENHHWP